MKAFLKQKIDHYCQYLEKDLPILLSTGEELNILNFNFKENSEEFLNNVDNDQATGQEDQSNMSLDEMKLNDYDIERFLRVLGSNKTFSGELILSNQNLSDESVIRLGNILKANQPHIVSLDISNNPRISYLGGQNLGDAVRQNSTLQRLNLGGIKFQTKGANRIIEAIKYNFNLRDINLGKLTNTSLEYLISFLSTQHHVKNLSFGEDAKDTEDAEDGLRDAEEGKKTKDQLKDLKISNNARNSRGVKAAKAAKDAQDANELWTEATKTAFLYCMRECLFNKQILSIDIACDTERQQHRHNNFICELSILCEHNRSAYLLKKNNDYKSKELNTQHPEYYDSDNHSQNAFKFSVKTYIQNVIETLLDEGLYFLERERENMLRDEKIFEITKNPINKTILEDLLTADGSILVLCKYMIRKIQEKPELGGEF